MWGSQRAGIDPGGGRWWQRGDRAAKTVNIPHRSCWVKPSYFSMIFEALKSPEPTLELPSQKVSSSSASSRNSRQVTNRSRGQMTNRRAKAIVAENRWARHLPRWRSGIRGRVQQFFNLIFLYYVSSLAIVSRSRIQFSLISLVSRICL